jgi:dTDP-glucose 4,6-dehydratase
MPIAGKRALVTGAGGFIGSHLSERLVQECAHVRAFVRYNSNARAGWLDHSPLRRDMEVFFGDIGDRDSVLQAFAGIDVVFHLAALIGIPYSYAAPAAYVRTNVEGTLNVLQAARALNIERVLQTSTSEVYGTAQFVPISEAHPLQGQSPYSASKIAADKLAESFHLSFELPVVVVRPFNTFGPRQSNRAVIPTVITQCLAGDRVRIGSTAPLRDFNFIDNTVSAFLAAATAPAAIGQTVHFGSGREISIGDLIQTVAGIVGKSVQLEVENERIRPEQSEVGRLLADNSRAKAVLGWSPQVSLEEGLARTVDWFRGHLHLYDSTRYVV